MKTTIRNILLYVFILTFLIIAVFYNIHKPIILILQSYNTDYSWTRDVDDGLKKTLKLTGSYTLRWHYMDAKNNPQAGYKVKAGIVARRVIDEIKPDIILAVDDDAQEYAAKYYIDDPKIRIVFSGVNNTPESYGYDQASNVTGILERLPLSGIRYTLEEIQKNNSDIGPMKIMHLSDSSGTVQADDNFINNFKDWKNIQIIPSTLVHNFREWKKAVNLAPTEANFLLISNYRQIYDDNGKLVPPKTVMKWTIENSKIPIIGANGFTVEDGAKFAVATSPFEQGEVAGKMAIDILQKKLQAKDIPITQTKQYLIYMRGKYDLNLPHIYEAFARAADKYWD